MPLPMLSRPVQFVGSLVIGAVYGLIVRLMFGNETMEEMASVMSVAFIFVAPIALGAITVLLVNNGMYGTIRMHQERHFPGRVHGTALVNPDFDALARAYGCFGERVSRTADFAAAFERASAANRNGQPALLEWMIDPQAITVNQTLNEIRQQALGAK